MPRIVSVWLPRWPILRFLAAQNRHQSSSSAPVDPARPFVLAADVSGTPRVAAANAPAEQDGIRIGETIADARAKSASAAEDPQQGLQVRAADPAADDAALRRLTLWATRYTPAVAPFDEKSGADGLFLDIAGAAHLFGGEAKLLADLDARLARLGLPARLAVAATAGAAWSLAHFQASTTILAAGEERAALAPLPIAALRLSPDTQRTLRRLGFRRVGALVDNPRAPFAARFERELLRRIDQALGRTGEPLTFILPPPVYHSLRYLMEPVASQEAVVAVAERLMRDIVHALARDGVGARTLRLALYRVDGGVQTLDIGLTRRTRSAPHVARLIALKLERNGEISAETLDAGFGFEAVGLAVTTAERMDEKQAELVDGCDATEAGARTDERCAELIDGLAQRLGPGSVQWLAPVASHLPERAETAFAANADGVIWPTPDAARPRPLLLFAHAEPAEVMAQVPEGPPRRFRWRGVLHAVAQAQGPERIAAEWWRAGADAPTRDYYLVEDDAGRRFWLFREGLYARETADPRWFVHGLFA
ncbi:MAG TPA: DNA polymerase Y family protein [Xanthobacteraceae bacterium]|jgi:protein ImuB